MPLPAQTCNAESNFIVMKNLSNLSRKELISRLRGQSRSQVVETCLALHSRLNNRAVGTLKVPIGSAIGMAELASSTERRNLKKASPDLFQRAATAAEVEAGKAAVMSMYRQIDMTEPGAAKTRINFRAKFPAVFK